MFFSWECSLACQDRYNFFSNIDALWKSFSLYATLEQLGHSRFKNDISKQFIPDLGNPRQCLNHLDKKLFIVKYFLNRYPLNVCLCILQNSYLTYGNFVDILLYEYCPCLFSFCFALETWYDTLNKIRNIFFADPLTHIMFYKMFISSCFYSAIR